MLENSAVRHSICCGVEEGWSYSMKIKAHASDPGRSMMQPPIWGQRGPRRPLAWCLKSQSCKTWNFSSKRNSINLPHKEEEFSYSSWPSVAWMLPGHTESEWSPIIANFPEVRCQAHPERMLSTSLEIINPVKLSPHLTTPSFSTYLPLTLTPASRLYYMCVACIIYFRICVCVYSALSWQCNGSI